LLRRGGLVAHQTGTLPGAAAMATSRHGLAAMQQFKQRQGPFLLLADSNSTALSLARYITQALRRTARESWPGGVTLVFPARPGLAPACYQKSELAVRVDGDNEVRRLARLCGGLLLSSSLNRRGRQTATPGFACHMRHHRHLLGRIGAGGRISAGSRISATGAAGRASKIIRIWRNDSTIIRQ